MVPLTTRVMGVIVPFMAVLHRVMRVLSDFTPDLEV